MPGEPFIDFKHVREHADFSIILAHYGIRLLGHGDQRRALCPFHPDKRPSLSIDLAKGRWHCFGCETKGNLLEFVADKEGLDRTSGLREAAKLVADLCGIDLAPPRDAQAHQDGDQPSGRTKEPAPAKDAPQASETAPEPDPDDGPPNPPLTFALKLDPEHPYLVERGLDPASIETFGLGYCGRGMMRGRVCIPIHDSAGNLVAYAGRFAGPEEELPAEEGKYKLPPRFQKTRVLFNLNRVVERWPEASTLVLAEGYFGTIRLHALGVPAVALMGSDLAEAQLELLEASGLPLTAIAVLMDGNPPGREASRRCVPLLAERYLVRALPLPDGTQPDTVDEVTLKELLALVPGLPVP